MIVAVMLAGVSVTRAIPVAVRQQRVAKYERQSLSPRGIAACSRVSDQCDPRSIGMIDPAIRSAEAGERPDRVGAGEKIRWHTTLDASLDEARQRIPTMEPQIGMGAMSVIGAEATVALWRDKRSLANHWIDHKVGGIAAVTLSAL